MEKLRIELDGMVLEIQPLSEKEQKETPDFAELWEWLSQHQEQPVTTSL